MSDSPNNAAAQFKALHQRDQMFIMPNPWDAGTAKVLAGLGFEALATSSAALAWSLGKPDNGVTRAEAIDHGRLIGEATNLPVNGDFESGYGETPQEVAETIRQAIEAGIAGCSIEDKNQDGSGTLYDLDEATRRLEAARNVIDKAGSSFVLTGRTECFVVGHPDPLTEAVRRLKTYEGLGADVVYAPGSSQADQIKEIVAAVNVPVNVHGALGSTSDDIAAMRELGVTRVSLGARLAAMAWSGFFKAAEALAREEVEMEDVTPSKKLNTAFS